MNDDDQQPTDLLGTQDEPEYNAGPLSILTDSIKNHTEVLISCRHDRKLLGRVKAFDRHCNMVLEDVTEIWSERPKTEKGQKREKKVNRERTIPKMFLRGDCVICVLKNPLGGAEQQETETTTTTMDTNNE
mmetsp:Transcript_8327/g.12662  ORF Transcript_8327/g.12662 Transcript_8327/m.12662 type:complete len:131 (+) Transcript_8327:38-430(+)